MKTIKNLTADQIRKSILQLAIQGKLVKQDPNDEPASELVKRIYEEKQRLIKEGKLKKDKNESYIYKGDDNCYYEKVGSLDAKLLEDIPFELPNGWTWIRQSNLCWLDNGNKTQSGELPYLEAKVIRQNKPDKYQTSGVVVDSNFKLILVDGENSGEIFTPPFKGYMGSTFKILDVTSEIDFQYLLLIFELNLDLYRNSKTGAAIPHLNKKLFKKNLIALPPLNEQLRIVKKISEFDPLLERYQNIEKELSSYETSFEGKLKASILQYAIEGKLVKQDPNDEPASVLLERIKKEKERLISEGKIKRDKHESEIIAGDDKNYYENLPNGWCLAFLDLFGYYKKGPFGSSLTKSMFVDEKTPNRVKVYEQKNAIQHNYQLGNYYISKNKYNEMRGFSVFPGDIIVSCAGTIGEIYQLPIEAPIGIINQALMKITLFYNHIAPYYTILLKDKLYELSKSAKGTAIKNIPSFDKLKPAKVLLPPENEQIRILNQLKKIFDLLL